MMMSFSCVCGCYAVYFGMVSFGESVTDLQEGKLVVAAMISHIGDRRLSVERMGFVFIFSFIFCGQWG